MEAPEYEIKVKIDRMWETSSPSKAFAELRIASAPMGDPPEVKELQDEFFKLQQVKKGLSCFRT